MMKEKDQSHGFTLIELVLVMVLTSIIMSIAMPHMGEFYKSIRLDSNARKLSAFLEYAKGCSLNEGSPCRLSLDKSWKSLKLAFLTKKPDGKIEYELLSGIINEFIFENIELKKIKIDGKSMTKGEEIDVLINPLMCQHEVEFEISDDQGNNSIIKIAAGGCRVMIENAQNLQ